jgi:hypothetical protein
VNVIGTAPASSPDIDRRALLLAVAERTDRTEVDHAAQLPAAAHV